ncbi:TPA: hypothetical protein ACJ2WO_001826 [Klebsiella pneumoniae]
MKNGCRRAVITTPVKNRSADKRDGAENDAIAAVILGGTSFVGGIGTITGTLVGALIIATLNNGMTLMGVSYFWQLVIKGAVIIIAVLIDKYRTRHHQSA